jgi:hypothetical protein
MRYVLSRPAAGGGSLLCLAYVALVAGTALPAGGASAATVRVMNCHDSGAGSLRSAVAGANSGDTIDLSRLGCRKIVLTSGAIDITQPDLSLVGPGRTGLVLDGNDAAPVLVHDSEPQATPGTLLVKSMTLANGNGRCVVAFGKLDLIGADVHHCAGGGVFADVLRLVDSRLFSNHAPDDNGGGASARSLSAVHSHVWNNSAIEGGGLWSAADASLSYSSVSQNRSIGYGGGIYVPYGNLLVNKSTVSNNQASDIYTGRGGGAWAREAYVYDSTFSGNVANSASALLAWDYVRIANSTIAFNRETQTDPSAGGAVVVHRFELAINPTPAAFVPRAPYDIDSSIIARNQTNGMPGKDLGPDWSVAGANNLIERATIPLPADTLSANPLLGPLADNGGPTRTHALRSGSPAIDRGSNARNRQYDQRGPGFLRLRGRAPDLGAVESGN